MKKDSEIFQSLLTNSIIGAALGALLLNNKRAGATIGAIAGAVLLATIKANEEAKKLIFHFVLRKMAVYIK